MEKVKKFLQNKIFKWSALAVSSVLFVSFLITLIVVCSRDYSLGRYTYEESMAGVTIKYEIDLDDDDEGEFEMTMSAAGDVEYVEQEFKYKVIDGNLLIAPVTNLDSFENMGTIDSFKLIYESNETGTPLKMVATNKSAVALKTISIVLVCVFGVMTVASGLYIFLTRKHGKKESVDAEPAVVEDNAKVEEETVETKTE